MQTAWFDSPYVTETLTNGDVRRRVALDEATSEVHAAGGEWSETEIDGGRALIRMRAPLEVMTNIALSWARVTDPTLLWTPTRREPFGDRIFTARSLADVTADVLTEAQLALLEALVETLIAEADRHGYVRLPDRWGPRTARLLVELGKRGYRLDRVSTGTFPTTGVLDTFTGTDGTSPPSASWTNSRTGAAAGLEIQTNAAESAHATNDYGDAYRNTGNFGPDAEAYATISSKGGNNDEITVSVRLKDEGTANFDLYQFNARFLTGTDDAKFFRADNGGFTQLGATISQEWAVGEKLGGEAIGSTLTLYRYAAGAWAALGTRTDATYGAAGKIGLQIRGAAATCRADDYGGGTVGTAPANTALPTISGTAGEGELLTGTDGTWTGDPAPTFTYQWRRCDSAGANGVDIGGATAATYTIVTADVGSTIRIRVTATNAVGSASADSAQTAVVIALIDATVTVDGDDVIITTANYPGEAGLESDAAYVLIESYTLVQLIEAGTQQPNTEARLTARLDASNSVSLAVKNGNLEARKQVAGVPTVLATTAYDATAHKWLMLLEAGGTLYWRFSAEGVAWTNLMTADDPISLTSVTVQLMAETLIDDTVPVTVRFRGFNVAASGTSFWGEAEWG